MIANTPAEKVHFDRIYLLSLEIEERQTDIKELYKAAKDADIDVKLLRRTVKLAMEDEDKKAERRELEHQAQLLIEQLGPLGAAAVRAGVAGLHAARGE